MKLTDGQYVAIGAQVSEADTLLGKGYIAVAAVAPLLLAGAREDEVDRFKARTDGYTGSVAIGLEYFLKDRLASVTAKPDPAVQAVKALLDGSLRVYAPGLPDAIVAAVGKTRGGK